MKHTMRSSISPLYFFIVLAFAVLSQGAPLRGSRRSVATPVDGVLQRPARRLMEQQITLSPTELATTLPPGDDDLPPGDDDDDDDDDDNETVDDNNVVDDNNIDGVITSAPSAEELNFTQAPTGNPTGTPTSGTGPVIAPPPTAPLPPNGRRLYPFSLRFQGDLEDELAFRRDLELYMLSSMRRTIPALQNIALDPAPVAFGQRSLQQASLLGYQGAALLEPAALLEIDVPTTEDIQNAQLDTLEESSAGALQDYLNNGSSSPQVTILQVQVSDFDPIAFAEAGSFSGATLPETDGENDSNTGIIVGAILGVLIVGALVGFFVWHRHVKPPPPPPYEFEQHENDITADDIVEINKSIKVAITESTTDSEGVNSPKSHSPADSSQENGADRSMEVIAFSPNIAKRRVINLWKPAKNSKGIESTMQETEVPPRVSNGTGDDDGDSTFGSLIDARTIMSNEDDSMAGFSLTDGPEPETSVKNPITPQRLLDSWAAALAEKNRNSPELQNKAQLRWFYKDPKDKQPQATSADTKNGVSLDGVSNQLRDSVTGHEKDTDVFMDDDEDEVEVVSRASEDYTSSYKEDDSSVHGGSVSEMSDGGFSDHDHILDSPGPTAGALGYFYREQEEQFQEDFDVLPPRAVAKTVNVQDNLSDVPSDERNNDPIEQDLTGFSKVQALENELDGITGTRSHDYQGIISPQNESMWEENPEMMEAWIRERRRIKRQARNRREERKQPPLTMEI